MCAKLGVPPEDSFQTVALYEAKDMRAVLTNIHSLGRVAQSLGYCGPTLGAKLADENLRSFTDEQQQAALYHQTFLTSGSGGAQDTSRHPKGLS